MADIFGSIFFEFLMWPAEWLTGRLWRLHTKEPTWAKVLSAIALSALTVIIWIGWFVIVLGVPVAIVILVAG